MIVPGVGSENDYNDPIAWKAWIKALQGWGEDEWGEYYAAWKDAPSWKSSPGVTTKSEIAKKFGVKIFNWQNVDGGSWFGDVGDAASLLSYQMKDMQDVTILAHSKGGAVAEEYLHRMQTGASGGALTAVARFALIDPAINPVFDLMGLLGVAGFQHNVVSLANWNGSSRKPAVETINNWLDPIGGRIEGAKNFQALTIESFAASRFPPLAAVNWYVQGIHGLKTDFASIIFH